MIKNTYDAKYKYEKSKTDYINLVNILSSTQYGGKKYGTYADNEKIYSVNLMFCYIDKHKPKITYLNTKKLFEQLKYPSWGDISPFDVINNMNNEKFMDHKNRILNANMDYPIIIEKKTNIIIDGLHRLAKAYILKKKKINAYVFDEKIMDKFVITHKERKAKEWKDTDWNYYESLSEADLNKLCHNRFYS